MRKSLLAAAFPLAAILIFSFVPSRSDAATTTIQVSLWDKGANVEMPTGLGIGVTASGIMISPTMGITATPGRAKAGIVTFEVKNDSKEMVHEMLVIPIADENTPLPFLDDERRVDEEAAHDLGEVAELEPAASGSLTLDLKSGRYALVCNIAGHFMAGMWTVITVAP